MRKDLKHIVETSIKEINDDLLDCFINKDWTFIRVEK